LHTDDMVRVHPLTDWTHNCHKCGGRVGIYPTGQKILEQFPDITITCNRCRTDKARSRPLPEPSDEPYHSRWATKSSPPKN
jgi:hypothetical protein